MSTFTRFLTMMMNRLARYCWWTVTCVLLLISGLASADTWFVDDSATGSETGETWTDAFTDLQDALAEARAAEEGPHEILVGQGIYKPGTSESDTFLIDLDDLKVRGGFAGVGAADPDEQKIDVHLTTLSGDIGIQRSDHIVTIRDDVTDISEDTLLEGFTITLGDGPAGSGIFCVGTDVIEVWPRIEECTLTDNDTGSNLDGGAIKCRTTRGPTIEHFLTIRNCTMSGNDSTISGGCGGAVVIHASGARCQVAILNTTIDSNQSLGCGGGVYINSSEDTDVHMVSCTISNNDADGWGGGIYVEPTFGFGDFDTSISLTNCVIADNSCGVNGGGIMHIDGDLILTNCTVANNQSDGDGGGYFMGTVDTSIVINSIFWGNSADGDPSQIDLDLISTLEINYTLLQGGIDGIQGDGETTGEMSILMGDPLFCSAGDYELQCDSPAIEKGDNSEVPLDQLDVDDDGDMGERTPDRNLDYRKIMTHVDLGAFEYQCPDFTVPRDCSVGFDDLQAILLVWGLCAGCDEDLDDDGAVGFTDLLTVLNDWGPCPCSTGSTDDCADRDLGANCECRDTLTDLIENGTQAESQNARCWLDHYIECHDAQGCNGPADCPDDDPCGKH